MTRVSQTLLGAHSSCPFAENDSRESRSWPVSVFVVKPSRRPYDIEKPAPILPLATGTDTFARVSNNPSLPNGTATLPPHLDIDGFALVMLIKPPSALRPKSALCHGSAALELDRVAAGLLDEA